MAKKHARTKGTLGARRTGRAHNLPRPPRPHGVAAEPAWAAGAMAAGLAILI